MFNPSVKTLLSRLPPRKTGMASVFGGTKRTHSHMIVPALISISASVKIRFPIFSSLLCWVILLSKSFFVIVSIVYVKSALCHFVKTLYNSFVKKSIARKSL